MEEESVTNYNPLHSIASEQQYLKYMHIAMQRSSVIQKRVHLCQFWRALHIIALATARKKENFSNSYLLMRD